MLPLIRLACLLVMLGAISVRAQDAAFTHAGVEGDARRYEATLRATWQPRGKQARELRSEGAKQLALGRDVRAAAIAFEQAVVLDSTDADTWLGLARALLALTPSPSGSERYDLPVHASAAAWSAYQRAQTPTAKAAALIVLHEAFKRRSDWRSAIDSLRASIALAPDAQAQADLEKLVAEHGFRIAEYKVDTDATQPRLCIQFSEDLARGQVDWAQYFRLDGKDPQAVAAEARQ